ncbi:MAG: MOSC domain-containing protein [Chloroflexi bacterium]|nr:MOSC domain-containing protein [Chloroflexota bacterium]
MVSIHSIVYQPAGQEYDERLDHFMRIPIDEAELIEGHGMQGDAKSGHNPNRQLNLISTAWLKRMGDNGYKTEPGDFGEQMTLDGLVVEDLQPGDRLQLGDDACIEITKARTGCSRLELVQGKIDESDKVTIGMLAKVVSSGTIRVGDAVKVIAALPEN